MLNLIFEITFALIIWLLILNVKLCIYLGTEIWSQEILKKQALLFFELFFTTSIFTLFLLFVFYLEINNKDFFKTTHIIKEFKKSKNHFYGEIFTFFVKRYENSFVKITYYFLKYRELTSIFYLCVFFIPLIVLFFLFTEMHFRQFYYYYSYSFLLFVVLIIMNLIIYLLNNIGPKLFPKYKNKTQTVVRDFFSFRNIDDNETAIHHNLVLEFKKEYITEDFPYFYVYYYKPMENIFHVMNTSFLPRYKRFNLFVFLIYFFIQTLCWGYIYFFLC